MDKNLAIETLKSFVENTDNVIAKDAILILHPELAESEDEKIRKEIIKCIETLLKAPGASPRLCDWLAYLEKQKDEAQRQYTLGVQAGREEALYEIEKQKEQPTNEEMLRTLRVEYEKGVADTIAKYEQKPNPYTGTGFDYNGHHWGMCARDGGVEIIVDGKIRDRVFFESESIECNDSVAKEMFIKALERAVEQTKKGYELTDCDKHSWWEDFKAYSGIKPAEWSEEDEKIKHDIENLIHFALRKGSAVSPGANTTKEEALDWLKSLRPQHITYTLDAPLCYDNDMNPIYPPINYWKPNEEQMTILEKVVNFIKTKFTGATVKEQLTLKSLFNDLKKL